MDQLSVITVEDPNTKLNNAVSSTDRALFHQQCKETSNSSSANDQTSSEIHRLAIDTDEEARVKVVSWPGMLHIMIRLRILYFIDQTTELYTGLLEFLSVHV